MATVPERPQVTLNYHQKFTLLTFGLLVPFVLLIGLMISQHAYWFILPIVIVGLLVLGLIINIEYLALVLLTLPLFSALLKYYVPSIFGLGVNAFAVPLILVILFLRFMMNPKIIDWKTPALPFMVLYLMFYGISLFQTDNLFAGVRVFFNTLVSILIFILIYSATNHRNFRKLLVGLLIFLSPSIFVAIIQLITGRVGFGEMDLTEHYSKAMGGTLRVGGMEHMSELSVKCVFVITLSVVLIALFRIRLVWKMLFFSFMAVAVFILLKTYSREGWLAFLIMGTAVTLRFKRTLFVIFVGVIIVIGVVFWTTDIAPRVEPLLYGEDASFESRFNSINRTLHVIKKRPITGYGIGTSSIAEIVNPNMVAYFTLRSQYAALYNPTHSFYIEEWLYTGLGGIFFSMCIIVFLFRKALKTYRTKGIKKYREYYVLVFIFLITVITVFFQNLLGHTKTPYMWFFWGVCVKIPVLISQKENLEAEKSSEPEPPAQ